MSRMSSLGKKMLVEAGGKRSEGAVPAERVGKKKLV